MKHIMVASLVYLAYSPLSSANCLPPMQTLFACTFEDTDSRVELCHEILKESTANASSTPGDAQSYSLARGTAPTELYFTPTSSFFNVMEASAIDKKIYGNNIKNFLVTGYQNVDYIYAAFIGVSDDTYDGFYGAEVRVFENTDDFWKMQTGSEVARHFCRTDSVIVNQYEFRP